MDQMLSYAALPDGTQVAYAVAGNGPMLVCVPGWVSHLELGWATPHERSFYEAFTAERTVVRYDLPGCGISDPWRGEVSLDLALAALEAVVAELGAATVELFGVSLGAAVAVRYAAAHPDRVGRLALYGGWLHGAELADPEVQESLLALVVAHWGLGSDVLADIFAPDADRPTRAALALYQRGSATAAIARDMLALSYRADVSDVAGMVAVPSLVVHRSEDRAVPVEQGRALAGVVPGARFEELPGRSHLPYVDGAERLAAVVRAFLGLPNAAPRARPELTPRQREVAALVADGMSNREIAARLVITERSAESHVERILQRMGFRSRAQIAAWHVAAGRQR